MVNLVVPFDKLTASLSHLEYTHSPIVPSDMTVAKLTSIVTEYDTALWSKSVIAICYLTARLIPEIVYEGTDRGLKVDVKSFDLPTAQGLGSSAAFCVALSASLLRLRHLMFGDVVSEQSPIEDIIGDDSLDGWSPPAHVLNVLNGWAFVAGRLY